MISRASLVSAGQAGRIVVRAVTLVIVCGLWALMVRTACSPVAVMADTRIPATALEPAPRKMTWWQQRHDQKLKQTASGKFDLVFIGDSITHFWERHGRDTWTRYYEPRRALNLGYSGDCTEHVLWRLDHGEMKGISPKVVVLMIGTNNTGQRLDPPEFIAQGVKAICDRILRDSPQTRILLLAIFPRGLTPHDPGRVNNDRANEKLAQLADNEKIVFLNLNHRFLDSKANINLMLMPDALHPQAEGYRVWAEAMEPILSRLLGEHEPRQPPPSKPDR